jgi:molecular chaperone DnaK (HSP70)
MAAEYSIGIDLGTTNCVLAYAALSEEKPSVHVLLIPQLVAASTIEARDMLPSFLYIATAEEKAGGTYDLPWEKKRGDAVGALAHRQAAEVPTRTVVAAKSWLAYSKVDRHQPILPWNAPADVAKVSPVEASVRYLAHLAAAWNAAFPEARLADQHVVLTVPASFDASARELTREAALEAGLPENVILLEEPQAALYAWLADMGDTWRRNVKAGDTLLVCDVGGGTTDFTLIEVINEAGELALRRVAVGNHTLLGGDNMDLTLAHFAGTALSEKGVSLDPWQSVSLWHSCRTAKESLLAEQGKKTFPVAVLGRGSKLVGTVSVDLDRSAVKDLLVEGFFPACSITDKPARRRASGFREIGLPFENDTAITRHLAAFLAQNADESGRPIRPTHLLFNGGVFKAAAFRDRLTEVIGSWFSAAKGGEAPKVLEGNDDLDYAVARGAAYYGVAKRGRGVRIRGGAARSYYVGVETAGLAIPGAPRPLRALCVVPFGMEEGTEADVPGEPIGLVVGEPAVFRFFSSSVRKQDKPGDLIPHWTDSELEETDSLEANLTKPEKVEEDYVPVRFHSHISELGVFELWCVSALSDERWKLEFSVRDDADAS